MTEKIQFVLLRTGSLVIIAQGPEGTIGRRTDGEALYPGLPVLKILDQSLEHGERFGKVYGNRDLGEILPDTVLHDTP